MKKAHLSLLTGSLLLASLSTFATPAMTLTKGDGIIVNDVSDMVTEDTSGNIMPVAPLLTYLKNPNIKYVFLDFMNFNTGFAASGSVLQACDGTAKKKTLIYVSYNQLKLPSHINGQSTGLGPSCIPGQKVTSIFNGVKQGLKVIPMIDGDASTINGTTNTQNVIALANIIATTINSDTNASGVSFDLEGPSLDDSTNAQTFIATLANALAAQGKYVAIFDGKTVMAALQVAKKLPKNVIDLHALYDASTCNPSQKYNPCTPEQYAKNGATAGNPTFPTMEVLPAAGTTRLYERKIITNLSVDAVPKPTKKNPHPSKLPKPQAPSFPAQSCATLLEINQQPFNTYVANQFLCTPQTGSIKNDQTYHCFAQNLGHQSFANFISKADCHVYTNPAYTDTKKPGSLQSQYVLAALQKVNSIKGNANLLGVVLYNAKPSRLTQATRAFNALTATKGYYNSDVDMVHYFQGYYPESITPAVWSVYTNWRSKNPIKQ